MSKQRGAEMSSRLIPPKPGASAETVRTISSVSLVARQRGQASIPPVDRDEAGVRRHEPEPQPEIRDPVFDVLARPRQCLEIGDLRPRPQRAQGSILLVRVRDGDRDDDVVAAALAGRAAHDDLARRLAGVLPVHDQ